MKQLSVTEKEIPDNFRKFLKEAFKDNLDNIDVFSEFDKSLSLSENKTHFLEAFNSMLSPEFKEKLMLKNTKDNGEKFKIEEMNRIKEEESKLIQEWKKSDYEDIDIKSFDVPKHFLTMVCKGISKSCFLIGQGGTGKTYMAINILKKEKKDYVYQNTYSTPLELYKFIYYNKDKLIILDDVEGIWNNDKCLAILKACLWETDKKYMVTMNTTDKVLDGVPKAFEFTGKIIILSNKLNLNDLHISALVSRSNYFELNFTYKEILRIMKEIVKKPYKNTDIKLRQKAFDMLVKNTDITTQELNFRSLVRTYDMLIYDENKAEMLLKATLKVNEDLKLVKELMESGMNVQQQIAEFSLKTGKSRITYFRTKEKIKKLMGEKNGN